jgi:hypothetical protein
MSVFDIRYTRLDGGPGVFDRRTVPLIFKEHVHIKYAPEGWRGSPTTGDRDLAIESSTLFRVGDRWVLWEDYVAREVTLGEATNWFNRRKYVVIEGGRKTVSYGVGIPDIIIEELKRSGGRSSKRDRSARAADRRREGTGRRPRPGRPASGRGRSGAIGER